MTDFEDDTMLTDLSNYTHDVEDIAVKKFSEVVTHECLPNKYVVTTESAKFLVIKDAYEFRLIERFETLNPKWSEYQIAIVLKVAKLCGMKILFEPKYMN